MENMSTIAQVDLAITLMTNRIDIEPTPNGAGWKLRKGNAVAVVWPTESIFDGPKVATSEPFTLDGIQGFAVNFPEPAATDAIAYTLAIDSLLADVLPLTAEQEREMLEEAQAYGERNHP